jgi:hypothetical protein
MKSEKKRDKKRIQVLPVIIQFKELPTHLLSKH